MTYYVSGGTETPINSTQLFDFTYTLQPGYFSQLQKTRHTNGIVASSYYIILKVN